MRFTKEPVSGPPLELWAGPECTIVRIGDRWRDQVAETGHRFRLSDIDLLAGLGVRTVRYPILWESVAPDRPDRCDFGWTDERLARLEALGIEVIAGLLHHGSGPAYTDLLDPDFAAKFEDYAGRVAARYPNIRRWTPVNEPLTTARFSALYGHWYPHRRDYPAFLRALVNQCEGTRRAMAAIRRFNPAALLLQTEDVGKTFATPPLAHQAAHENERRWLSLDLLAGRVDRAHPFHALLIDAGISEAELDAFADGGARPDQIGVNHYLTSERFLDHRLELYPDLAPGGNGRDIYVDAEAVRVGEVEAELGLRSRLHEVWARYAIPLAVTEVHHGCTREQQLRWFAEAWEAADRARRDGVDVRAVTLWSIFGAVDWRSLLTRTDSAYDVGALDIRGVRPRPTAIARAAVARASGTAFDHPVLDERGWWRQPDRLYSWSRGAGRGNEAEGRPLLIAGGGALGQALVRLARHRGLACRPMSPAELDIRDPDAIAAALEIMEPWAVIDASLPGDPDTGWGAGMDKVAVNAAGPGNLARACRAHGAALLAFSADLVFDGLLGRPYLEEDTPNPPDVHGQSGLTAERLVRAAHPRALVVRTAALFGPWHRNDFAWTVLEALRHGEPVSASADWIVSPTFLPDLCHAALDLLIDGETGIWHLANAGKTSWFGFAQAIAAGAGFDPELVFARTTGLARNTALASSRGTLLRPLASALDDYLRDVGATRPAADERDTGPHSAASISTG